MTITLDKSTTRNVNTTSGDQNLEFKEFVIDPSSINHLLESLIKSYNNPVEASFRETLSNAVDATVEAGSPYPVEVTLPTYLDPYLIIKDHGVGMSPNVVEYVYRSFGKSTKLDSFVSIGAKGLGSKSPLAIADSFTLETVHEGVKTIASVEQSSTGGGLSILFQGEADDPNGTTISVAMTTAQIEQLEEVIESKMYNFPVPVLVNDSNINMDLSNSEIMVKNIDGFDITYYVLPDMGKKRFSSEVLFNVGGIVYKTDLPYSVDTSTLPSTTPIMIDIPIGSVTFPASRDAIELSQKSLDTITKVVSGADICSFISECVNRDLDTLSTIDFLKKWSSVIKEEGIILKRPITDIKETTLKCIRYKNGLASQGFITRYRDQNTVHVDLTPTLFQKYRSGQSDIYRSNYIITQEEINSVEGYNSKKFRAGIPEGTALLIVENEEVRDLISTVYSRSTFKDLTALVDFDEALENVNQAAKEYRLEHKGKGKPKTYTSVNRVLKISEDGSESTYLDDLDEGGTYYYDPYIPSGKSRIGVIEDKWWKILVDSGEYSFSYPILVLNPKKSLKAIKNINLIDINTIKSKVLKDITRGAHRKYLLSLEYYMNYEYGTVKNIITHMDKILDKDNDYKPGKFKKVLNKVSRYKEKEPDINYHTLFTVVGKLGGIVQRDLARKDMEIIEIVTKTIGIYSSVAFSPYKLKTLFWALNHLDFSN